MTKPDRGLATRDFWLLAIVCLGAAARFWAVDFGLPNLYARPDESGLVGIATRFFGGDVNPHFFNYPSLFLYLLFGLFVVYLGVHLLLGGTLRSFQTILAVDPSPLYVIARSTSAVMGTASLVYAYRIGRRLGGRVAGLSSALFLAVCYLHVRDSHFGVTDVTMTFFVLASVEWMLRALAAGGTRDFVIAGLVAGLATGTKYGGVCLAVPLLAAIALRHRDADYGRTSRYALTQLVADAFRDRRLWFALAGLGAAFLVTTPFALLDVRAFLNAFTYEAGHLEEGHSQLNLGRGWWYHLRFTLPYGTGWLMLASSAAGAWAALRADWRKALVVFLFPLTYYIVAGRGYTVFLRYMIPVVPFVCVASAVATARVAASVRLRGLPVVLPAMVLALLIAGESIYASVSFLSLLGRRDTRAVAAEWAAVHLPGDAAIYQTGYAAGHVQLPPSLQTLRDAYEAALRSGVRGSVARTRFEYASARRDWTGFRDVSGGSLSEQAPRESLPAFIIAQESPLVAYSTMTQAERRVLESRYRLMRSFVSVNVEVADGWYDQDDAFYLPFRGFRGVERPGPTLHVYERFR